MNSAPPPSSGGAVGGGGGGGHPHSHAPPQHTHAAHLHSHPQHQHGPPPHSHPSSHHPHSLSASFSSSSPSPAPFSSHNPPSLPSSLSPSPSPYAHQSSPSSFNHPQQQHQQQQAQQQQQQQTPSHYPPSLSSSLPPPPSSSTSALPLLPSSTSSSSSLASSLASSSSSSSSSLPSGSLSAPSPSSFPSRLYQHVVDLTSLDKREHALLELSKKREEFPDLAPILWHSFGTISALLQEIVSIYPLLSPPRLTPSISNRCCNALALLQCVASHQDTRNAFLNSHLGLFLYPFLNTTCTYRQYEYLRLTSLGVIGALVKMDDSEVISFLLQTEIIPLALRIMDNGSELSKTVATFIIQKILLDDMGLNYICATYERFSTVSSVLSKMVLGLVERPSVRLLKHIVRCYLRLSDNTRARDALRACIPVQIRDQTFLLLLKDDPVTKRWLAQLLFNIGEQQNQNNNNNSNSTANSSNNNNSGNALTAGGGAASGAGAVGLSAHAAPGQPNLQQPPPPQHSHQHHPSQQQQQQQQAMQPSQPSQ